MHIKHLNKKEIEYVMKKGKNVSSPTFLCKFFVDNMGESSKNGLKQGYFISALSPKGQFKTAVLRNKARRKIYGAINLLAHDTAKPLFKAVFIANKSIFDCSHLELQEQITRVFSKIGV
jgi:ribonuclease P protein component